jgi:hypothetical protein
MFYSVCAVIIGWRCNDKPMHIFNARITQYDEGKYITDMASRRHWIRMVIGSGEVNSRSAFTTMVYVLHAMPKPMSHAATQRQYSMAVAAPAHAGNHAGARRNA